MQISAWLGARTRIDMDLEGLGSSLGCADLGCGVTVEG